MFTKKELTKIISFCANKKSYWYLTNERTELTSIEYSLISESLKKIMSGFPLNYLIGQKEFYSRNYKVSQDVLIPRDETEILVEKAIEEIEKKNCYHKSVSVLELGTGSGVIAISLVLECIKRNIKINVTATEICEKALKIAKINAKTYQVEIRFLLGNWWNALRNNRSKFDIVVTNPPYVGKKDPEYMSKELHFEPNLALYGTKHSPNGDQSIKEILSKIKKRLNKNGVILLEHGSNQRDLIINLAKKEKLEFAESINDLSGLPRILKFSYH